MSETDAVANPGRSATRQRALWIFAAILLLAALAWLGYWIVYQRHFESTDDAYVAADIIQVTSEVAGTVTAVHADDTQSVRRGDLLVELDPADANLGVAAAEAELAQAVRDVSAQFARETQLRADLAVRQLMLERARRDLQRREPLTADGAVSEEELAHARDTVAEQEAAVAAARSALDTLVAQVRGTSVATHPQVLRAEAALRNALLALRRTRLLAPITGTVAKRSVEIGERIGPGTSLLALVSLGEVWVDANVREVQVGRIRIGQAVTVRSDAYGSGVTYHGRVAGLAAGSGSAFALLPAQNASGNWIKIVQRVPIRVSLDPEEVRAHPLRVGTSIVARIDVSDASGAQDGGSAGPAPPAPAGASPATAAAAPAAPAALAAAEDPAIEPRIREIVTANSGPALRRTESPAP